MFFDKIPLDLSNSSNREMITENRMAIKNCVLTEACINEYLGKEIQGWQENGLIADKLYKVYRPIEEIKKALSQYNGLDLVDEHHPMNGQKTNRRFTIGASGESATIEDAQLLNTVFVTDKEALRDIEMATKSDDKVGKRCLSCAYDSVPVFEAGEFKGKPYDLYIKDLKLDHIALVKEGRVSSAMISDDNSNLKKEVNTMKDFIKSAMKGIFGVENINDNQLEQVKILFNDKAKDSIEYEGKGKGKEEGEYKYAKSKNDKDKKSKDSEKELEDKENDPKEHEKEKSATDKKTKDSEDEKEKEEKREKEINDSVNARLKEIMQIQNRCSAILGGGRLSDAALNYDADKLINDTLEKKGIDAKKFTNEEKHIVLKALSQITKTTSKQVMNDTRIAKSANKYSMDDLKKLTGSK